MGTDQYHEPAGELSAETRTFARMITSLTEEAEAINWYAQRISIEPDDEARAIMENAQQEEFKHFAMDLEFLIRRTPKWKVALQHVLFTDGDIVEAGEEAEEAEEKGDGGSAHAGAWNNATSPPPAAISSSPAATATWPA